MPSKLMGKIGGEIGCQSNVGRGATFILRFPVDGSVAPPTEVSPQ